MLVGFEHHLKTSACFGTRFCGWNRTERSPQTLDLLGFAAAGFASHQMPADQRTRGLLDLIDHIIRKLFSDFFTLHGSFSLESFKKISRSSFMARCTRTLMAPTSHPMSSAICSYFIS